MRRSGASLRTTATGSASSLRTTVTSSSFRCARFLKAALALGTRMFIALSSDDALAVGSAYALAAVSLLVEGEEACPHAIAADRRIVGDRRIDFTRPPGIFLERLEFLPIRGGKKSDL